MTKQPSMYTLLGECKVICLPGSNAWHANKCFKAFRLTHFIGKPIFAGLIMLTIPLVAGLMTERNNQVFQENQTPTASTTPLAKKAPRPITFEYAGLFHLKVVIKPSTSHSFFSDINITTTAEPSFNHSKTVTGS